MSYPQAPWSLQGYAILTLHLVNIEKVRPLIPAELDIISVWPGKTLASLYLSNYQRGSVLEYSELIVAPAMVSYGGKIGGWISHIYVDNPDSVAGGREIWGLPKELAEFTWEQGKGVRVTQRNRQLCSLNYNSQSWKWRQGLALSSFSVMDNNLLTFTADFNSRLGFITSQLEVPTESAFSQIGLEQPFLSLDSEQLNLRVDAPKVVGQRTNKEADTNSELQTSGK
jgi:hypothetical protein